MSFTLPENLHCVKLYQGAANAVACDNISCKSAHKVWFQVIHTGSSDTDLVLTLTEGTEVATCATTVTATCPIWADTDMGTSSDTLVRQTDAASWTVDTGNYPNQMAIIEWDPAKHTAGYDCITLADSGGNASNTVTILAWVDPRYKADQPLSAIID